MPQRVLAPPMKLALMPDQCVRDARRPEVSPAFAHFESIQLAENQHTHE
jgi:hypothetical protein